MANDVPSAVKSVAANLSDREFAKVQAKELTEQMDAPKIVHDIFTALLTSDDATTEAACIRLMLGVTPFPFTEVANHYQGALESRDRAYTLHLLNLGAASESEVETLKSLAKTALSDGRPGMKRYGEAQAYSAEGKRVCEVAYNILVSRLSIGRSFKLIDVDNLELHQRDILIKQLCAKLGVTPPGQSAQKIPSGAGTETATAKTSHGNQPIASKPATQSATDSPPASKSWLFWLLVVIATTLGAVWLFLRKSKH